MYMYSANISPSSAAAQRCLKRELDDKICPVCLIELSYVGGTSNMLPCPNSLSQHLTEIEGRRKIIKHKQSPTCNYNLASNLLPFKYLMRRLSFVQSEKIHRLKTNASAKVISTTIISFTYFKNMLFFDTD
jgi:hypothetical protein